MLKNKLKRKIAATGESAQCSRNEKCVLVEGGEVSPHFSQSSLWQRFYSLECELNGHLDVLQAPAYITHVYNPLQYASELHCAYLRKFLSSPKPLVFVGMNPGPNGMGQTGVPFGNVSTVREMQLSGEVHQPTSGVHVKRPINGMECSIDEPSGVRLWGLFKRLANNSFEVFSQQCYVHNFCPLAFFDKNGRNLTPSELKGDYKASIRDLCLSALDKQLDLLQPEVVVAVGEYVHSCLQRSRHKQAMRVLKLPHPSPRSLNNQNWPAKAEQIIGGWDILKYFQGSSEP